MAVLKRLARIPTLSKESLFSDYHLSDDKSQRILNQANFDPKAATPIKQNSKTCPTFPCALWFDIDTKIKVFCVNCKKVEEREWHGKVVGKGIHGFVMALVMLIKHRTKSSKDKKPLMGLITLCGECSRGSSFCSKLSDTEKIVHKTCGSLVLGLSEKEVEEVVSSKAIVLEGVLMSSIMTVDGFCRWKEWYLLRPFLIN